MTFADKTQHQLFLEPEGETTQEYYLNGFSSSLPLDIQLRALQAIPAFRDVQIYRPGYAIEYDFFDPTQLRHNLETKQIRNLFFAGQINGTTGYEEAGGQGLIAGINAHINCHGGQPFILGRDEAYIGVLIDDLVTKGVDEPYRMFTSRAEYRILLRMDDADMRLTEKAWKLGLAKEERYKLLTEKREAVNRIIDFARNYSMKPALINPVLEQLGTTPLRQGCKLVDLINRPQVTLENMAEHVSAFRRELDKITEQDKVADRRDEIVEAAEILIKYEGYIGRERIIADKLARLESIKIKGRFDYNSIQSLSTEARQKLVKIDPETIAQASRIPGVSPSDIKRTAGALRAIRGNVPRETKNSINVLNKLIMSKETLAKTIREIPDFPIPGILFYDVTTLFKNPSALQELSDTLYEMYKDKGITKVVGIESRGFIMGPILATRLGAGFVPMRKPGKLPAETIEESYDKEYGKDTVQIHKDAIEPDDVVLLHDDLLATGGTMAAAYRLVKRCGVEKAYVNFVIELKGLNGRNAFEKDVEVTTLLEL